MRNSIPVDKLRKGDDNQDRYDNIFQWPVIYTVGQCFKWIGVIFREILLTEGVSPRTVQISKENQAFPNEKKILFVGR